MIREADQEGIALYGQSYVQGIDFLVLTHADNLLIPNGLFEHMRAAMMMYSSLALNN
jgi:hypothetical protein